MLKSKNGYPALILSYQTTSYMLSDTFSDNVLVIYCFVDDFLKGINTKTDKQPQRRTVQIYRFTGN